MPFHKVRKSSGTTLIEILVVIVVFTIGILAVAQIFPKGFQILNLNRAAAMATFMARSQVEQLNAHPDTLPDIIVPIVPDTGLPDANFVATSLAFEGTAIGPNGLATLPDGSTTDVYGNPLYWESATGFNNVRGIIGESQPIPSPKLVGSDAAHYYGGLVVLQFGPTDLPTLANGSSNNLAIYGNDFTRNLGVPPPNTSPEDFEFFFNYTPYTNPPVMQLQVWTAAFARNYQLTFTGYAAQPSGNPVKRSYVAQYTVAPTATGMPATLVSLALNSPQVVGTDVLTSIDYQSIRVQPIFTQIPVLNTWSGNPFEVKILNQSLGTFLFSPYSYSFYITRPTGPREALRAKFNYAVRDWRILRDEFRIDSSVPATHQLPIQSLKTTTQPNVDGTSQKGSSIDFGLNLSSDTVDHFVLIDLNTGGTFVEQNSITVDKNRGIVSFAGTQGQILLPDGSTETVNLADRPVRALYQARYEWAVQVLKASSSYSVSASTPGIAQYYVGASATTPGGLPTRLYFPPCDTGRKVVIGQLWYEQAGQNTPMSLTSQDFEIHPAAANSADTTKLPYIDIRDADPAAVSLDVNTYGYAARDVKGSSLVVRVVWNPNTFQLTNNAQTNLQNQATWAQSWRTSTTETFLDQGVASR